MFDYVSRDKLVRMGTVETFQNSTNVSDLGFENLSMLGPPSRMTQPLTL